VAAELVEEAAESEGGRSALAKYSGDLAAHRVEGRSIASFRRDPIGWLGSEMRWSGHGWLRPRRSSMGRSTPHSSQHAHFSSESLAPKA